MRISPISIANRSIPNTTKTQPSFKAVLLNKATVKDTTTGELKDVAIIELETEYRELLADLRLKHKNDIPEAEFKKLVEKSREITLECSRNMITLPYKNLNIFSSAWDKEHADNSSKTYAKMHFETVRNSAPETNSVEVEVMDSLVKASGEERYLGDFEFMEKLAKEDYLIADINSRLQERNIMTGKEGNTTSIGEYVRAVTEGKREVMPRGGYGLLKKEYGEALTYLPSTIDSIIWTDHILPRAPRMRVLMAVEPQADENYRNLSPDTKVYGAAEIYTDRLTDAAEDMISERIDGEIERMEGIKKADKEFDELFQKYKNSNGQDQELKKQLGQMAQDICKKYHISWGDFMELSGKGKDSYIKDAPDDLSRKVLEELDMTEEKAIPLKIWRLSSTDGNYDGAEKSLLDAISKKAKFCGIFTNMWVSNAINSCKEFKIIPNWNGEKLFKQGFLKREKLFGVMLK